ncbi:hypothetical protein LINGRAHAP2_LOCUS10044, partial [Linum grandiflorum]
LFKSFDRFYYLRRIHRAFVHLLPDRSWDIVETVYFWELYLKDGSIHYFSQASV